MPFSQIIITTIVVTGISLHVSAQPHNWQNMDLQQDGFFGISTEKAYKELLKGKKATTVIVGIVDTGVDTLQEDLSSAIWTDPQTGDHGWNYIGSETGQEDITRLVGDKKTLYDSLLYTGVPEQYRSGYKVYRELLPQLEGKISAMEIQSHDLENSQKVVDGILRKMGKATPSLSDLENYEPENEGQRALINLMIKGLPQYSSWQDYYYYEVNHKLEMVKLHLAHGLNIDNRESDTAKGNCDVTPDKIGLVSHPNYPAAFHGTHVAGIIGALRNNGIGMDGVADHVQIMMLKSVGNIRELRDKNLALAIRYAVDHGAKIINLSFGKPYTLNKKDVDSAVQYAMEKDVLIVHAAGNDGTDLDVGGNFYPDAKYAGDKGRAKAWIVVGASGSKNNISLAWFASNYGKNTVDVFAPGVQIYSTLPNNEYESWDGTSMAAPVVSGLAALIREYYPKLTAVQVKDIIMQTVVKSDFLKDKCVSGGIVNAYNALKLAASYK